MKVFLSSTYVDLIEHRKAAHDALEQLGLHVIGMESFGARPEDSTTACLKEVEESNLFVGIYAHRYGYIPKDSDVSITEDEEFGTSFVSTSGRRRRKIYSKKITRRTCLQRRI